MKLAELPLESHIVELRPVDSQTFKGSFQEAQTIHLRNHSDDLWMARTSDGIFMAQITDPIEHYELVLMNDGISHIEAWVEYVSRDRGDVIGLFVAVYKFNKLYSMNESVSIQVAEDILDDIIQKNHRITDYEQAIEQIRQECLIDVSNNNRRLVIRFVEYQLDSLKSFRIYGKRGAFDVSRVDSGYRITRHIRNAKQQLRQTSLIILEGDISIVDATVAAQQKQRFKTELDMIVAESNGSYLNVWDEYNQLERKKILAKASRYGWVRFVGTHELPDGRLRLTFKRTDNLSSFIKRIERANELDLVIAEELPSYLTNKGLADNPKTLEVPQYPLEIINSDNNSLEVRLNNEMSSPESKQGYLFVSIHGDSVRLDRRKTAWDIVRGLDAPIPGLALLLEQSKIYTPRSQKKPKMKSSKLQTYFDIHPNPNQLRSLELTLQTPDILLIQGPPGTGKTQIISALSRLITDEKQHEKHDLGKVLLTSYQHAAVDNVAERTTVMDLPTPKVGGKRNETHSNTRLMQQWKEKIHERVDHAHNLKFQPTVEVVKQYVQDHLLGYQRNPGNHTETVLMLQTVSNKCLGHLTPEKQDELDRFVDAFSRRTNYSNLTSVEQRGLERATRSLRTDPISFMDDGPSQANKLKIRLEQAINAHGIHLLLEDDIHILQNAADWNHEHPPPFLEKLSKIAEDLLLNLHTDLDIGRLNVDVHNIMSDVLESLHHQVIYHPGHIEAVAQNFIDDLEYDPNAVELAIRRYTSVLAATCQQSDGYNFHTRKTDEGWSYFDTVIVDEASRANPLDLLIPLVQAKRRIILVGDHRQLPQLLEPDVESDLSTSTATTRELLQKSLFERLFNYMDELSKKDGVTRRITLNKQYRMHPRLAQFVSDTFYAPYGEAFDSVFPEEYFAHGIEGYEGIVATWINIPLGDNSRESSSGGSRSRPMEAKRIAHEVKHILELKPTISSIGIITFYSAQVTKIKHSLQENGVLIEGEHGLQILPEYASVDIQVGTVDAFQGKEFDVVFLSPVRSNENGNFGFLTLENRLCVALSRQKKLLIVVGDVEMYRSESALENVAGLAQFYKLCCEESYGQII